MTQTCSSRSCRILKDWDRSRVCRQVHAVNSALHAARDRATRAREAQTTRSLRTRLLCRIRCILGAGCTATHRDPRFSSIPAERGDACLSECPFRWSGERRARVGGREREEKDARSGRPTTLPPLLDFPFYLTDEGGLKLQNIRSVLRADQSHHPPRTPTVQLAHINCCILLAAYSLTQLSCLPFNTARWGVTLLGRQTVHTWARIHARTHARTRAQTWRWTFRASSASAWCGDSGAHPPWRIQTRWAQGEEKNETTRGDPGSLRCSDHFHQLCMPRKYVCVPSTRATVPYVATRWLQCIGKETAACSAGGHRLPREPSTGEPQTDEEPNVPNSLREIWKKISHISKL